MERGSVDPRKQAATAGGYGPSESSYTGNAGAGTNTNGTGAGAGGGQGAGAYMPSPYLSKELPTSAAVTLPPRSHEPAYDPRARDPRSASPTASPAYAEPQRSAPSMPSMPSSVPHHVPSSIPPHASSPAPSGISTDTIWVRGLPRDVTVEKLANYFGEFGQLKMDRSKDPPAPHINILPSSSGPGCEARLVWDTPEHAPLAVDYFNGKHWPGGGSISVSLALAGPPSQPPSGPPPPSYNQPPSYPPPGAYPPPPQQHSNAPPSHSGAPYQPPPPGYGAPPQYGAPQGPPKAPYDPRAYDPYAYQAPPTAAAPPQSAAYDPYAPAQSYNQPPPPQGYPPSYPPPSQNYSPYGGPPPYSNTGYPPQQGYNAPPQQHHQHGGHGNQGQGGQGGNFQFKGKGGAARAGDWICPACQNNNFSWRTSCKQCNLPRPASAAVVDRDEQGGPPRRNQRDPNSHPDAANDWNCPKCGFRNFSKREYCHDCRTPKPYGQSSHGPVRYTGGQDRSRPY